MFSPNSHYTDNNRKAKHFSRLHIWWGAYPKVNLSCLQRSTFLKSEFMWYLYLVIVISIQPIIARSELETFQFELERIICEMVIRYFNKIRYLTSTIWQISQMETNKNCFGLLCLYRFQSLGQLFICNWSCLLFE